MTEPTRSDITVGGGTYSRAIDRGLCEYEAVEAAIRAAFNNHFRDPLQDTYPSLNELCRIANADGEGTARLVAAACDGSFKLPGE